MWNEKRSGDIDDEYQVRRNREKRKDVKLMDTIVWELKLRI
jgi:hypothetical protein